MGQCIGPVKKLERREGISLDLKGKAAAARQDVAEAARTSAAGTARRPPPPRHPLDHEALAGHVLRAPQRDEIAMPVTEQLAIERYARR